MIRAGLLSKLGFVCKGGGVVPRGLYKDGLERSSDDVSQFDNVLHKFEPQYLR